MKISSTYKMCTVVILLMLFQAMFDVLAKVKYKPFITKLVKAFKAKPLGLNKGKVISKNSAKSLVLPD